MSTKNIQFIPLNKLKLDVENPRLPLSFRKSATDQNNIVNWLLEDSSIIELMLAIGQNDFFIGESLLVVQDNTTQDGYIVVEGNRRLTSVLLLSQPELANIHKSKIQKVLEETTYRPTEIPCIIFSSKNEILQYLGYRHVTGVKSWSLIAKARYLHSLLPTLSEKTISGQAKELAKKIGSRTDYVKRVLISYDIYQIIEDNNFYKIPSLDETTFHFNYIKDSLSKENIRKYIDVNLENNQPLENLKKSNLAELINWFFRKNEFGKTLLIGDSKHLGILDDVLSNDKAKNYFIETGRLYDAIKFIDQTNETFHNELSHSLDRLKHAHSYIHIIEEHLDSDSDLLDEIIKLSRMMKSSIIDKRDQKD